MITIKDFTEGNEELFGDLLNQAPWLITGRIKEILNALLQSTPEEYKIQNNIAIHFSSIIEEGAVIKGPAWISEGCFIGSGSYLREGVFLAKNVSIGPGCEIKSSILFAGTRLAHFNYIGDSIIGCDVNFEAGAVIANHYNERKNKNISVICNSKSINTEVQKFGAMIGDYCSIGANAVLSPGTLLGKNFIVKRLELIEQNPVK
jgi:NDP-sugar pyrophosphorylase family protein